MVRNYKRKKDTSQCNDSDLVLAMKKVADSYSCKATAAEFNIPRSTLQKKVKSLGDDRSKVRPENFISQAPGHSRVFTPAQEEALARYITEMEKKLMGLEGCEVRKLAYQFAERLKIPHTFNNEKKQAGKDWLRGFMSRHELSHRKAEHTSSARANGFNKQSVQEFFTLLKDLIDEYAFTPDRIYNVDETNISAVPKSSPKIIAKKGRRQVGGLTAGERGEGVTVEVCMSASGSFMPPMLIFPRVKENLDFLEGAPPGAWAEFHKSGYMPTEIFTRWFKKFVEFSKAKPDKPVLLLLDGHATHVKNLEVIDFARENGVILLCFPPHCTHKMQPLDVGFNGPLNKCFGKVVNAFQRQGNRVTMRNLFSIFGTAFIQEAKMETAINSFRRCGIVPLNSEIFTDADFVASRDASFSSSSDCNDAEREAQISPLLQVMKDIVQESSHESRLHTTACQSSALNQNSGNDSGVDEIRIPLSYLIQAKPLINMLSSCLQQNEDLSLKEKTQNLSDTRTDQLSATQTIEAIETIQANEASGYSLTDNGSIYHSSSNPLTQQNLTSSTTVTEKPIRKGQRKGQTAVLTSDSYKENLMAEKNKNIKKEKVNKKSSTSAKISDGPKTHKRKQTTVNSTSQVKKPRKPFQNLTQLPVDNSQVPTGSIVHLPSLDNIQSIIQIPDLPVLNNETFFNNEPVEIYYVTEDVAKALNI